MPLVYRSGVGDAREKKRLFAPELLRKLPFYRVNGGGGAQIFRVLPDDEPLKVEAIRRHAPEGSWRGAAFDDGAQPAKAGDFAREDEVTAAFAEGETQPPRKAL